MRVDRLEERQLLTVSALGGEFRINEVVNQDQQLAQPTVLPSPFNDIEKSNRSVAVDHDGDFVVVWTSYGDADGDGAGVFGRLFNRFSIPLTGDFQINQFIEGDQRNGTVTMDADGDFTVAWESSVQDPYDGSSGIYARRFNSVGKPLSDEFQVNTIDIGPQIHPAIASDNDGNFIIAWETQSQDGSFFNNLKAQRFHFDGSPIGSEFRVDEDNEPGLFADSDPAVAMAPNGNFAISWDRRIRQTIPGVPFIGSDVFFRMYDGNGSPIIPETPVNRTGVDPWTNLLDEPGPNDGSVFLNGTLEEQRNSSITMDDNGNVTIVWESLQDNDIVTQPDLIDSWGIFLRRFHADGRAEALFPQDLQVNPIFSFDPNTADPPLFSPFFFFDQLNPSVGLDADGDLFVVYDGYGAATYFGDLLDTQGIWLRRWTASSALAVTDEDTGTTIIETVPGALNWPLTAVNSTRQNTQQHPTIAVQPNGSFIVVWSGTGPGDNQGVFAQRYRESQDPVGPQVTEIRVEAFDTVGQPVPDDRQLVLQGDQVVGTVTTLVAVFDEQASTAGGTTGTNSVLNRNNWKLLRNGVEVLNSITSVSFQNNPLTNKWEATVTVDSNGPLPGTPALTDGNYELIALNKIRDVAGNPLGSNGTDEDGFSFSRSFNVIASQGGESLVNVTKPGVQALLAESPQAVATDASGNYVVTWTAVGQDGDAPDQTNVYARRFSADGAPLSGEFRVNTTTLGNQSNSAVAMTPDGDFIIVWAGESDDIDRSWDIYAQRFDSLGNRIGGEFLVNTTTTSIQSFPTVAIDSEGDFFIAWQSFGQETSTSGDPNLVGYGVYAQRYSAAGEPLGGVNDVQTVSFLGNPISGTFSLQFNGFVYGPIAYEPTNAGKTTAAAIEAAFRNPSAGVPAVDVEVRAVSSTKFEITFVGRDGSRNQGQMVPVAVMLTTDPTRPSNTPPSIRVQTTTDGVAGEFLVNDTVLGNQRFPQAAMDADGDFVIVWVSTGQEGDQFFESNVYGKTYVRNELLTGAGGASIDELVFGHHHDLDALEGPQAAQFDGLTYDTPSGPLSDDFVLGGTEPGKWGPPQFGTGAVITWAFMGAGVQDSNNIEDGWTSVSLDSVMPVGYKEQIRQAFAAWSNVANITFVEVTDGGEPFGDEGTADIRVGAHAIDGAFGVLAHAFFPPENAGFGAGDLHFDAGEPWQIGFGGPGIDIFQVTAHELGHALGLGHTAVPNSLMNPIYSEGFRGPQFDDIAGIQFLYGAADNGATRPEFRVNQTIAGNQFAPSVAMDLDGDFVVTWTSYGQDRNGTGYGFGEGGQNGVFARRFTADGNPMTSQTFVESYVSGNAPLVIADLGATASELKVGDDFIVTDVTVTVDITHPRVSDVQIELYPPGQDPFAGGTGIVLAGGLGGNGRNYNGTTFSDNAGISIANAVPPFTGTFVPLSSLAGAFSGLRAQGTWRLVVRDTATGQVGQLNGWSMNFRGIIDAGDEFQVNRFADGNQQYSRVGMNGAGDFIIAWESFQDDSVRLGTPSDYGVYAQRYVRRELLSTQAFATGGAVGSQFRVPFTKLGDQRYPSVALDAGGDFVAVWTGRGDSGGVTIDNPGVFQRRFTATSDTGAPIVTGVLHLANEVQRLSITGSPTSGSFSLRLGTTTYGPFAYTPGNAAGVAAAMDAALSVDFDVVVAAVNNFEFTFTFSGADGATDIAPLTVVGATFVGGTNPAATASVDVPGVTDPIVERDVVEQTVQKLVVRFSEQLSIAGGITGLNSVINPGNWIISRNGVVLTDAIVSVTFGLSQASVEGMGAPSGKWEAVVTFDANTSLAGFQPLEDGEYVLTALPAIRDLQGNPLDGNFDGSPGGSFNRRFFIQIPPPGGDGESRVNEAIPPVQRFEPESPQTIAADADGDYVVVWTSAGQDGDGDGVYFRRFSANGTPLGPETLVNQTPRGNQNHGNVALDADGDYVITWTSYGQNGDGANSGNIYARRYTSDGIAVGDEFLVNTTVVGNQRWSSVAIDVLGDTVIVWTSEGQDGSGDGIFAQRYNSRGELVGDEFQVNQTTTGNQRLPDVAMDALGNFFVTWTSSGQDGSGDGIYVRTFSVDGQTSSAEQVVNTTTAGDQRYSRIAADLNGDLVIVWTGPDSSGTGVFFRTFDIETMTAGVETQANVTIQGIQQYGNVSLDHDGDFVITWSGNGSQLDQVDQSGVFARRYNADGTPRPAPAEVGGGTEFLVNTTLDGSQGVPSVALDGEGEFVVVWAGNGAGTETSEPDPQGIFQRRFRQSPDDDGPIVSDVRLSGIQILNDDVLAGDITSMNVFFGEEMSTVGDDLGFESVTNVANWALLRNGIELVGAIRDVDWGFAAGFRRWRSRVFFDGDGQAGDPNNPPPLPDGEYTLVLYDLVTDTSGNPLDGDYDGLPGGVFTRTFVIQNAGDGQDEDGVADPGRFDLSSATPVASDADGHHVVVWTAFNSVTGDDVYFRLYGNDGVALTDEVLVNVTTAGQQRNAAVAMDADGDFYVTWTSYPSNGAPPSVYMRRYTAAGEPKDLRNEVQLISVNTASAGGFAGHQVTVSVGGTTNRAKLVVPPSGSTDPARFREVVTDNQQALQAAIDKLYPNLLSITGSPTSGSFSLRVGTKTYGPFAYAPNNATSVAAAMEKALSVDLGVTVSPVDGSNSEFRFTSRSNATTFPPLEVVEKTFAGGSNPDANVRSDFAQVRAFYAHSQSLLIAGDPSDASFSLRLGAKTYGPFTYKLGEATLVAAAMETALSADYDVTVSVLAVSNPEFKFDFDATGNAAPPLDVFDTTFTGGSNPQARTTATDLTTGRQYGIVFRYDGDQQPIVVTESDPDVMVDCRTISDGSNGEILVNRLNGNARWSNVAVDVRGAAVVTWTGRDDSGYGIYAQRFNVLGLPEGNPLKVNDTTGGDQRLSSVAMNAEGNFVITWVGPRDGAEDDSLYYQVFSRQGEILPSGVGTPDLKLALPNPNTAALYKPTLPRVAMDLSGDFVIAFTAPDSSGDGVFFQRFTAVDRLDGGALAAGAVTQVNVTSEGDQQFARVAMDHDGDFTVVWSGRGGETSSESDTSGVFARRFDREGEPRLPPPGAQGSDEFRVNRTVLGIQRLPGVASDGDGDLVVVWTGRGGPVTDPVSDGVLRRRFQNQQDNAGPIVTDVRFLPDFATDPTASGIAVEFLVDPATPTVTVLPLAEQGPIERLHFFFGEELNEMVDSLGSVGPNSVENPENWKLFKNGIQIVDGIVSVAFAFNATLQKYVAEITVADGDATPGLGVGEYTVVLRDFVRDAARNDLDGDFDGGPGSDFNVTFLVAENPAGADQFLVNQGNTLGAQTTALAGRHAPQAVARDDDGDYVVVWSSEVRDPNNPLKTEVLAQLYNRDGSRHGEAVTVSRFVGGTGLQLATGATSADDRGPAVAMSATGDFVVTWSREERVSGGLTKRVYFQVFDAGGVRQGPVRRLGDQQDPDAPNVIAPQEQPSVSMNADGDFVIAWRALGLNGDAPDQGNIFVQRFSFDGVALGSPLQSSNVVNVYRSTEAVSIPINDSADSFIFIPDNLQILDLNVTLTIQKDMTNELEVFLISPSGTQVQLIPSGADGPAGGANFVNTKLDDEADQSIVAGRAPFTGLFSPAPGQLSAFDQEFTNPLLLNLPWTLRVADTVLRVNDDGSPAEEEGRIVSWSMEVAHSGTVTTSSAEANGNQQYPQVAMDARGDFFVVWEDTEEDITTDYEDGIDIFGQFYSASLASNDGFLPRGDNFRVNQEDANNQRFPTVGSDRRDRYFVVAWASTGQDGDDDGIFSRIYQQEDRADEDRLNGGSRAIRVNGTVTGDQSFPSVAMAANGDFIVAWSGNGQPQAAGESQQDDEGVFAQQFSADLSPLSSEFLVNTERSGDQTAPAVAQDGAGGFVVVWNGSGVADNAGVFGRNFALIEVDDQAGPIVGEVVNGSDPAQRLRIGATPAEFATGQVNVLTGQVTELLVAFGEELFAEGSKAANSVLNYRDNFGVIRGGAAGAGGVTRVVREASQGGKVVYRLFLDTEKDELGFPLGLATGEYTLRILRHIQDTNNNNLDGDYQGLSGPPGENYEIRFNVVNTFCGTPGLSAQGLDIRTTQDQAGAQDYSDVAVDADGDYVVVWADSQLGVRAQRYSQDGRPLRQGDASVIEVHDTELTSERPVPRVAMDDRGNFVVVWAGRVTGANLQGQTYDLDGIFAWRYDRFGTRIGDLIEVNTFKPGLQSQPDVAMDADGDFVVTWNSYGQNGLFKGIYGQAFTADGNKVQGEFQVNSHTSSQKEKPRIAVDDDGDFAIVWSSYGQDGSGWGVYGQRFDLVTDSIGEPVGVSRLGTEFRVNQFTSNTQREPTIAMDLDGDFVVAWQTDGQDGSGYSVFARRYNAAGAALSNEFRVNDTTLNWQYQPDIAMLDDGSFVIAWTAFQQAGDGDRNAIVAKGYTADGVAIPVSGTTGYEFLVNSTVAGDQSRVALAAAREGKVVSAFTSTFTDGTQATRLPDVFVRLLCFQPDRVLVQGSAGNDLVSLRFNPDGSVAEFTVGGVSRLGELTPTKTQVDVALGEGADTLSVQGGGVTGEYFVDLEQQLATIKVGRYLFRFARAEIYSLVDAGDSTLLVMDSTVEEDMTLAPGAVQVRFKEDPQGLLPHLDGSGFGTVLTVGGASADQADLVTLIGTPGNDNFTIDAFGARVSAANSNRSASVADFPHITVSSPTPGDTLTVLDSVLNDRLVVRPGVAELSGSGYSSRATGFSVVRAFASLGADRAELYDSSGNDTLTVKPEFAQLVGSSFFSYAKGFDDVRATSSGGQDKAFLYDSSGTDTLTLRPQSAQLVGNTYFAQTTNFPEVRAYSSAGGDSVLLYDGAGDDRLLATPEYSQLTGAGFFNYAKGFRNVRAYASQGANSAVLYSSTGNDELVAKSDYTQLSGKSYYNYAKNFGEVRAYAQGTGQAYLYDSNGDDSLLSTPQFSQLVGPGYLNYASGFATVRTFASTGNDAAAVYDSAGKDELLATPEYAQLSGSGYTTYVKNFKSVNVQAGRGGQDVARLQDSTADDQLITRPQSVELRGTGYATVARNFSSVEVTSRGGQDQAVMYTATTGTNELYAGSQTSRLVSGGSQQTVVGFSNVQVQATGGYNRAHLVDSVLADELDAVGDTAVIKNAAWVAQVRSFQEVTAETIFNDKKNTKQVSAVDYLFTDKWF